MIVQATVHGAISIVNGVAAGRGATLGIGLRVQAEIECTAGTGITIESKERSISSNLIHHTIRRAVPARRLEENRMRVSIISDIPAGYGLKSSSAISSAVSLASARVMEGRINDNQVLLDGVEASIEAGVSITGAYDDACACYYGGFAVTENLKRQLVRAERGPSDLMVSILVPRARRRGNVRRLALLKKVFERAWDLARKGAYWDAMTINGLAISSILGHDPKLIPELIERGALAASVSGNGPAVAVVSTQDNIPNIQERLASHDGRIITAAINNDKAEVHEL